VPAARAPGHRSPDAALPLDCVGTARPQKWAAARARFSGRQALAGGQISAMTRFDTSVLPLFGLPATLAG